MREIEILYGERSRNDVELTLREFRKHGANFRVDVAATGDECLRKLAGKSYDLVLVDYMLPRMDGLEVLREVIKNNYDAPVVIVTGRGDEEVAVEAMKLGAYDYVVKSEDYLTRLPLVIQNTIEKYRADKERAKLEEEIRGLKDYLEKIYNTADDPIYVIDYEGKFRDVNKKTEEVTGYKKEELMGRDFTEILAPEFLDVTVENFRKRIRGEHVPPYEIEIISKSGERVPLEIRASRLEGVGEIGIARDITERKKLEGELRDHAAQLEQANRLLELSLDIMSHDLLNQVTIIKGMTEVLEEPLKGGETVRRIKKSAERLEDMIENLKVFTKLESQEAQEFKDRNLSGILEEVIKDMHAPASSMQIKIESTIQKCTATAIPFLRDVFYNLLSNAIKYSPPFGRVVVKLWEEGDLIKLMVKDWGRGIPDEYKEKVFERFERGDKTGVQGVGLGLAIVKRVVELHKGRVWVEDNKPRGSVFYVELPKEM